MAGPTKPKLFVSYSHRDGPPDGVKEGSLDDSSWLSYVLSHLRLAVQHADVEPWSDRELLGGHDWKERIKGALADCDGLILLVSRHSIVSQFIEQVEVGTILERQRANRSTEFPFFVPILITPIETLDDVEWLRTPNRRPRDGKALSDFRQDTTIGERDRVMATIAREIRDLTKAAMKGRIASASATALPTPNSAELAESPIQGDGRVPIADVDKPLDQRRAAHPFQKRLEVSGNAKELGERAALEGEDVFFGGPEGSGKTVALHAFLNKSTALGKKKALIHFMEYDEELNGGPALWQGVAQSLYYQLRGNSELEAPQGIVGRQQLTQYLFHEVLPVVHPLVIGFDEVGRLRKKPVEVAFYRMTRAWRELDNAAEQRRLLIGLAGLERLEIFPKDDDSDRGSRVVRYRNVKFAPSEDAQPETPVAHDPPKTNVEPPPVTDGTPAHTSISAEPPRVVVLVHGIRTYALWQSVVRKVLEDAGFAVELTNYEYFDVFRFLFPLPFLRATAINKIYEQIRQAKLRHPDAQVSLICHSFGTYIVSNILKHEFDLSVDRVIFCGSVVSVYFPFEHFYKRFKGDVLNEVGNADFWPVFAKSLAWGYGSTGTYGFRRPFVRDRWHEGLRHSDFLNEQFCRDFWVPFLKTGSTVGGDDQGKHPFWLQVLSVFQLKYIILLLALIFSWQAFGRGSHTPDIPPNLVGCTAAEIQGLEASARANLNSQLYTDVYKQANDLERCDGKSVRPWFYRGAAAFYERNFYKSVEYFEEAVKRKPDSDILIRNLGDAYIEIGGATKARELYDKIKPKNELLRYKIGRAFFYENNYNAAIDMLLTVKTEFAEEGGRGKARILSAAANVGLSKKPGDQSDIYLRHANDLLNEGIQQDPQFWDGILSGQTASKHEGWQKARELLEVIYRKAKN